MLNTKLLFGLDLRKLRRLSRTKSILCSYRDEFIAKTRTLILNELSSILLIIIRPNTILEIEGTIR